MEKLKGINEKGEKVEIPITADGSIGLLALGAVGVLLWKKARIEAGLPNFADPKQNIDYKAIKRMKPDEKK